MVAFLSATHLANASRSLDSAEPAVVQNPAIMHAISRVLNAGSSFDLECRCSVMVTTMSVMMMRAVMPIAAAIVVATAEVVVSAWRTERL